MKRSAKISKFTKEMSKVQAEQEPPSKILRAPAKSGNAKTSQSDIHKEFAKKKNTNKSTPIDKEHKLCPSGQKQSSSKYGTTENVVKTQEDSSSDKGSNNSSKSIDDALSYISGRYLLLKKLSDQSKSFLENNNQLETPSFQDLSALVTKYRCGWAQFLRERLYYFLVDAKYEEACLYATQLADLADQTRKDKDELEEVFQEAQGILSKQFVETVSELKRKHKEALLRREKFLDEVRGEARHSEQLKEEHRILSSLYDTHIGLFNLQQNLDLNLECSRIARELENEEMLLLALCCYGHLYQVLGRYQATYNILKEMLPWEIKSARIRCRVVVNLSVVALLLGKDDESLEYAERSVDVAKETGNESYTARYTACSYGNIGLALEKKKKFREAIEPFEECMKLGEEARDDRVINNSYCNLARVYKGLGNREKAKKYFKKAVETPRPPETHWCDTEDFRFSGDYQLAEMAVQEKNWDEARRYLEQVIVRCERFRRSCHHSRLKITFNETQRKPYQLLQYVLLQQGASLEALVVAEKSRGRDFHDKIDREEDFHEHIDKPEQLLDIAKKRKVAILFLSTLEVINPNQLCMWFVFPDGSCVDRQISTEELDWDSTLSTLCVELFQLSELQERSRTEIRGVESSGDKQLDEIEVSIERTLDVVRRVKGITAERVSGETPKNKSTGEGEFCATRGKPKTREGNPPPSPGIKQPGTKPLSEVIADLTNIIIQPLKEQFKKLIQESSEKPQLLIIPQGRTFNIPYAALQLDGKPLCNYVTLIEGFSLNSFLFSTVQSEQVEQDDDEGDALVVGNPTKDLPQAETEAIQIAEILGVEPLIGQFATRGNVLERLPQAPIAHFACHGKLFDPDARRRQNISSLTLAPDGENSETDLTVSDVERNKMKPDMVVLSACHTARGQINCEGVLGLTRAFLVARAKCAVTALWAIPDDATQLFMHQFYANLRKGQKVAEALGSTMVYMQNTKEYADVLNWGAFKVFGANSKVKISTGN